MARLGDLGSADPGDGTGDRPVREPDRPARPGYRGPERRRSGPDAAEHPAWPTDPVEAVRGWSPDPEVEEAENHFEPPDPGPVLGGDPMLTMAWGAAVGVPVLFVLAVLLWHDMPTILMQAAGVVFVAGVGLLVWRMPHGPDDQDRGSGAVV